MSAKVAVLGAGAWGTALAHCIAQGGEEVRIWAREPEVADAINTAHENPLFLPGHRLDDALHATDRLADLAAIPLWLVVTPAQHLRTTLAAAPLGGAPRLVLCSKGIEAGTGLLVAEIAAAVAPASPLAVLSGPSFAADVAAGKPTAVTLAAPTLGEAEALARRLARPHFRPYASDDIIGCEVGGAVKNVLAIACGVVVGAELGESARAALIARGFAEMTRLAVARGGRADTLAGLSGLGDLVLTCGSPMSRNMSLGIAIGKGRAPEDVLAERTSIAEGAATAPVLQEMATALGIDMPIAQAVADLLARRIDVAGAIARLLARPLRSDGA